MSQFLLCQTFLDVLLLSNISFVYSQTFNPMFFFDITFNGFMMLTYKLLQTFEEKYLSKKIAKTRKKVKLREKGVQLEDGIGESKCVKSCSKRKQTFGGLRPWEA